MIQLDRFHPSTWWHSLRTSRATAFHYLGVMPAMLLNAPASPRGQCRRYGALRIRRGRGSAAPCGIRSALRSAPDRSLGHDRNRGRRLDHGQSRAAPSGPAMFRQGARRIGLSYRRRRGQRCRPGNCGRIAGEARRTRTAARILRRLLQRRSGDLAGMGRTVGFIPEIWCRVGDDGSFFFVDRSKNIVRRSGENIAAVEVESALHDSPRCIWPRPSAPWPTRLRGEEVFAFVVPRPDIRLRPGYRRAAAGALPATLAYYKAPAYVAFRAELPQTASQKLARAEIKSLAAAAVRSVAGIRLAASEERAPAANA